MAFESSNARISGVDEGLRPISVGQSGRHQYIAPISRRLLEPTLGRSSVAVCKFDDREVHTVSLARAIRRVEERQGCRAEDVEDFRAGLAEACRDLTFHGVRDIHSS